MQRLIKLLLLTSLLGSAALSAQTDEFVKLCTAPKLEEPMLLSINSLLKTLSISGSRNAARCKNAAHLLAEGEQINFYYHEMLTLEPLKFFPNIKSVTISGSPDLDPNSFQFIPQLNTLNLYDSTLKNFDFLAYFSHLKELEIYLIELTEADLPQNGLKNLEKISFFNLKPLDWNTLAAANKAKEASILYHQTASVPIEGDWLKYLTQLEKIIVENAQISLENQASLSRLTKLRWLAFSNVKLAHIDFVSSLINLETLGLVKLSLETLPEITRLKNLVTLNVSQNQLTNLDAIRNTTSLQILMIGENKITDLKALADLTRLRVLYAEKNLLYSVAPLGHLIDLYSLDIADNCIKDLPILRRLRAPHRNSLDQTVTLQVEGLDQQGDQCE